MSFSTPSFVKRRGVLLSAQDIPYPSALIFNAGVAKIQDEYVMVFRNDYGFCQQDFSDFYAGISDNTVPHTNMGLARSADGIQWKVDPSPCFEWQDADIIRAYDPRLIPLGKQCAMCFAVDSKHGTRGGIALTEDFKNFTITNMTMPENRNLVLFPEKINGSYYRLERPFLSGANRPFDIWISRSPDLMHWGDNRLLVSHEDVPFANLKIGPGAPPLKTPHGWLTLFHGVHKGTVPLPSWSRDWCSTYYTGVMLLDLEDPSRIIAMAQRPLIVPETDYETTGFRGNVIFPGGFIGEPNGSVKIYYGAADTVECLATATIDELVQFCYAETITK